MTTDILLKPYQKRYRSSEARKRLVRAWRKLQIEYPDLLLVSPVLVLSLSPNATLSGEGPSPENLAMRDRERVRIGLVTLARIRLLPKLSVPDFTSGGNSNRCSSAIFRGLP